MDFVVGWFSCGWTGERFVTDVVEVLVSIAERTNDFVRLPSYRQFGEEQDIIDWEHRGEPGYPCDSIVFSQKDLIVAPGDIIVK